MGWPKGKPRGRQPGSVRAKLLEAAHGPCPGCQAKAARVAELEAEVARLGGVPAAVPEVLPPWQPHAAPEWQPDPVLQEKPLLLPARDRPPASTSEAVKVEAVKAAIRNDLRRTIQSASALPAPVGARCSKHKRMGCPRCP